MVQVHGRALTTPQGCLGKDGQMINTIGFAVTLFIWVALAVYTLVGSILEMFRDD